MNDSDLQLRRNFLRFLAGSPLLASLGMAGGLFEERHAQGQSDIGDSELSDLIASAEEAINVFDFESVARSELPPAHWGYLKTGVDDDATLLANRKAFSKIHLRPRRLVNVSKIDMSLKLFGVQWETPIVLAPAGSQGAFHDDGEIAVAKAARKKRVLQILSTVSSNSVDDVVEARGGPIWFQLYPTSKWEVTQGLVSRAEAAGCPVVVVTVDQVAGRNRDTLRRYIKRDTRECADCHTGYIGSKPNFDEINMEGVRSNLASDLTWDFVPRLRGETDMKILLKGIVTREDAKLCLEQGVDGIIVSNHGGRAEESGWGSLDSLPEVVDAVDGKVPVLIDGGFRRGMDFFKALALGANAVCIGRPYLWGLAAFGQEGVEKVLDILRLELQMAMMFAGTPRLSDISRSYIGVS